MGRPVRNIGREIVMALFLNNLVGRHPYIVWLEDMKIGWSGVGRSPVVGSRLCRHWSLSQIRCQLGGYRSVVSWAPFIYTARLTKGTFPRPIWQPIWKLIKEFIPTWGGRLGSLFGSPPQRVLVAYYDTHYRGYLYPSWYSPQNPTRR